MIFRAFRDYKLVRMGAIKNNRKDIQIASKSNLFIGIDSGMSHICHSTGTPIFMLDEKRYNPAAHPNKDLTVQRC